MSTTDGPDPAHDELILTEDKPPPVRAMNLLDILAQTDDREAVVAVLRSVVMADDTGTSDFCCIPQRWDCMPRGARMFAVASWFRSECDRVAGMVRITNWLAPEEANRRG